MTSNAPILVTSINFGIMFLIGFVVYFTSNPLALVGLYLLQQVPVVVVRDDTECDAEEGEESEESGGMGFLASVGGAK